MTKTVTNQRIEDLTAYVAANRGKCKHCGTPFWWAKTTSGRRIPIDFPDQILRGKVKPTHELVLTYNDQGEFLGEVVALAYKSKATHTVHLDTCEKRAKR